MKYAGTSTISTSGARITGQSTVDNLIEIGRVVLEKIPIEVIQLDHLSAYFKMPVDGIIGYDLFYNYVLLFDVDRSNLVLYQSDNLPDLSQWRREKLFRVDNNKIAIKTSFRSNDSGYVDYLMTIDTGNPDQVHLFPQAVKEGKIDLKKKNRVARGFSADTTMTENLTGKIREVAFATRRWKGVKTVIPTDPVTNQAFAAKESYGLIGQELLLDFNVIYDYQKNNIYFKSRR